MTRRARGGRLAGGLLALLATVSVLGPVSTATQAPVASARSPEADPSPHGGQQHTTGGPADAHEGAGHEDSEGLKLVAAAGESVRTGPVCAPRAPVRRYDVRAIALDITLNRYLDHDPRGRMFVLDSAVARVRDEERRNAAARAATATAPVAGDPGDVGVSIGAQADAVQPLTLRVRPGECLRIRLRNDIEPPEPASIHLHGSSMRVTGGGPAIASNPRATAAGRGDTVAYEWQVGTGEPEATHYFHPHGLKAREQVDHGLFGAVIVEPPGATWLDPLDPRRPATGWQAVIRDPAGSDFREFALYYHEVGDETYQVTTRDGTFQPLVDPITGAYRPDGRAINYRSEPFVNRLRLQRQVLGRTDESVEYSSYAFGDPATPVMRAYLGDPVKQRVIHGGGEVFHVHHVHGGATRWRRQPGAEPSAFDSGLDKRPVLRPTATERTDSQSIGPSETFDVVPECGAGGCQAGAGDFLYHCHVAHHYFAGMWGIWRVYNTLQDGAASTDSLPPLPALTERAGRLKAAVTSDQLAAKGDALTALVERQLPPRGVPSGYDASVLDWARDGDVYLGEPETGAAWPGYRSPSPGARPPVRFDPSTGRLAFPFLRPHLGARPPFAPGHGPAPFLDPGPGPDPPEPGASGPASVCPAGTTPRTMAINAMKVPVVLNKRQNLVDANGTLYVLRSQQDAVERDANLRTPLALRARATRDCVDVVLRSDLTDGAITPFSKVGLHIHFVQFDVQASDGLDTGFNYEQTVRPYRATGVAVRAPVPAGITLLPVADSAPFQPGVLVGVGLDRDSTFEVARVVAVAPGELSIESPLRFAHDTGEIVGTEFVRYRWYPDAQFGTAYFHDHVNALQTWRHGLFGALVAEPPDATWTDPRTGLPLLSGPIADVHTRQPVGVDVAGSFRELLLFTQDDQPLTTRNRSTGSSLNLRAEPLTGRTGPPALALNSDAHGDPATPVLEANLGDPVVIRNLVGGANEVHTTYVRGHWFRVEPWSRTSPPVDVVRLGISERFDLVIAHAGGPQRLAGDYLYGNGRANKLAEGSWGLIRVRPAGDRTLRPLPRSTGDRHAARTGAGPLDVCPPSAPVRRFAVAAVDTHLPMLGSTAGKAYVADGPGVGAGVRGALATEPLVLHAASGECIEVTLRNATAGGAVSMGCELLAADPATGGGPAAGHEPDQSVAPGATRRYRWYASPELGETVSLCRDWADPTRNPRLGLYGAVVIGPAGARFLDPVTGQDLDGRPSWRADVAPASGPGWRDFALLFQDDDEGIGNHRMPYTNKIRGVNGVNYQLAPNTPTIEARAGDPVRVHLVAPWSEQVQVVSLEGHRWIHEVGLAGSPRQSSTALGGMEAITLRLDGGAAATPGDYRWEDHRLAYAEGGLWGTFRVLPAGDGRLRRVPGLGGGGGWIVTRTVRHLEGPFTVLALVTLALGVMLRRQRRRSA